MLALVLVPILVEGATIAYERRGEGSRLSPVGSQETLVAHLDEADRRDVVAYIRGGGGTRPPAS